MAGSGDENGRRTGMRSRKEHTSMAKISGKRRHLPSSPFKPPPEDPPLEQWELNDLVTHDKYGLGRVILVESDTAVVVDFAPKKVRITAPFARMIKL
jgi:hypothetical protein